MSSVDEFGHHEVLHTAYLMTRMWSDFIDGHDAVSTNPELKAEAKRINEELNDFYQSVARVIVEKFGSNVDESSQEQ